MKRLCNAINRCTTLTEAHLKIRTNNGGYLRLWPESTFILSPTIARCTHFTLGGNSNARLFGVHTLAPISASTRLTHLSLHHPDFRIVLNEFGRKEWDILEGAQVGAYLETIHQEAANRVTSLALMLNFSYRADQERFWSILVEKFNQVVELRLQFEQEGYKVSVFKVSQYLLSFSFDLYVLVFERIAVCSTRSIAATHQTDPAGV